MSRFVGYNYFMLTGKFYCIKCFYQKRRKVTTQQSKFYLKKLAKEEQIRKHREEIIKIKAPMITLCIIPSP